MTTTEPTAVGGNPPNNKLCPRCGKILPILGVSADCIKNTTTTEWRCPDCGHGVIETNPTNEEWWNWWLSR